jgi:hypothetical protein
LSIGQLTLNLEIVTKKRIGKLIRLLPASMLEEIREVVDRQRRKFRHGCETQTALEPLKISTPPNPSIDDFKRRMIDRKLEEFLVFQLVQKLTTVYCGESSCLNEELCLQTGVQVTLNAVKAVASCDSGRRGPGVFVTSSGPYSPHHRSKTI